MPRKKIDDWDTVTITHTGGQWRLAFPSRWDEDLEKIAKGGGRKVIVNKLRRGRSIIFEIRRKPRGVISERD